VAWLGRRGHHGNFFDWLTTRELLRPWAAVDKPQTSSGYFSCLEFITAAAVRDSRSLTP